MEPKAVPLVFTPDNEPYLGRPLLLHFDQLISSTMEENGVTEPRSHGRTLTDHQNMACQVIAQAIGVTLSIRELIRQGYLFGGHVLIRSLVERTAILMYLKFYPSEIDRWKRGWDQNDAPSLAKMLDAIQAKQLQGPSIRGRDLTAPMNSLLHSKPDSAPWNMVPLGETGFGHAVSKILNRPELCDDLCANAIPWLAVIQGMMAAYFPDGPTQDFVGERRLQ